MNYFQVSGACDEKITSSLLNAWLRMRTVLTYATLEIIQATKSVMFMNLWRELINKSCEKKKIKCFLGRLHWYIMQMLIFLCMLSDCICICYFFDIPYIKMKLTYKHLFLYRFIKVSHKVISLSCTNIISVR